MDRKKLIAIGDSITRGTFVSHFDGSEPIYVVSDAPFAELVRRELGFTELLNYGANGIAVSSTSRPNPEYAVCRFVDETETGDCVLLACGTNDFQNSFDDVELGAETDETDVSFYGALFVLYEKIREHYDPKNVWVVTPIPRRYEQEKNKKGYVLDDYRTAIERRARAFGFHVIDGRKVAINPEDENQRAKLMPDGLHPNDDGHRVMAEYITEKMKEYYGN